MSHAPDPRMGSRLWMRSWLWNGPLVAFVVVSFLSAQHIYLAHTSAAQHMATLVSLVIWTALLTHQVSRLGRGARP